MLSGSGLLLKYIGAHRRDRYTPIAIAIAKLQQQKQEQHPPKENKTFKRANKINLHHPNLAALFCFQFSRIE